VEKGIFERFLVEHALGQRLAAGWHVRMAYLRRFGSIAGLSHLPIKAGDWDAREPISEVPNARVHEVAMAEQRR
jgi:hypothetical protein